MVSAQSSTTCSKESGEFEEAGLNRRQRIYLGRFISILIIPVIALCVTFTTVLVNEAFTLSHAYNSLAAISDHLLVNNLCWKLQRERGAVMSFRTVAALALQAATQHTSDEQEVAQSAALALIRLNAFYSDTDQAVTQIRQWATRADYCAISNLAGGSCLSGNYENLSDFRQNIRNLRLQATGNYSDEIMSITILNSYSQLVTLLLQMSDKTIFLPEMIRPWHLMTAVSATLKAGDYMSNYLALGSLFFINCDLREVKPSLLDERVATRITLDIALRYSYILGLNSRYVIHHNLACFARNNCSITDEFLPLPNVIQCL